MSRIMSAKGLTYQSQLLVPGSEIANRGTIIIRADVISKSNDDIFMRVKASLYPLTTLGCCAGVNNPYFVLSRSRPEDPKDFVRVYQSDFVVDDSRP